MIKLSEEQKMIYDDLSMPEKIAIFLIQLGEDTTTVVFSHMGYNNSCIFAYGNKCYHRSFSLHSNGKAG